MSGGRPAFRAKTIGAAYRRFRDAVLRSTDQCCIVPCLMGGVPVRRDVAPNDPLYATLQHHVPLALGGKPRDWNNAGVAHLRCNVTLGDGTKGIRVVPAFETSERW